MIVTRLLLPDRLADWLAEPNDGVALAWLGQAGFVLRLGETVVLVDPYLSDHLAVKYRGTRFPHTRMMPAPIAPDAFPRVDLVVCTHRHSDHMDPGTLPVLAASHPDCRFVVPASEQAHAERLGLPSSRLILAEAGHVLRPLPGIDLILHPVPAAHERLEQDGQGRHRFLGYCIEADGRRLYHSGDCIPYEGLVEMLRVLAPEVALLPVNGRDTERAAGGVPGNFTLDEAVAVCGHANISVLIPHHFGMFAFNTADPASIDAMAARQAEHELQPGLLRPDARHAFLLGRGKSGIHPAQQQEHDVDRG
ncbi:MAG: MBL fold metallo-hydrolase [Janthinobacterium lividum]